METRRMPDRSPARRAQHWVLWLVALALVTSVLLALRGRLDKAHVTLTFLLAVLGASAAGGRALGLTIAGLAFLAFNYFFLPPYGTLVVADPLDWLVLVAFLVTSAVAAELLTRAQATAAAATERADEVDRLAALGAETLSAPGASEALHAVVAVIRSSLDVEQAVVYRRLADGTLARAAEARAGTVATPSGAQHLAPNATGRIGESLADWLADSGQSAVELEDGTVRLVVPRQGEAPHTAAVRYAVRGADARGADARGADARGAALALHVATTDGTDEGARSTQPGVVHEEDRGGTAVRAVLLPLVVRDHVVGVLRVTSPRGVVLTAAQGRLLVALASYAALGVERLRLVETAERAEAERQVESLRNALLTAVSHDLRTPLTTIKGIAHEIAHGADPARARVIEGEADRLDRLVGDLLDLSRIQAGAVRPKLEVNTADELIGSALQRAEGATHDRAVEVDLPEHPLLAGRFDFTQALRVVVNLLENAAKYSPPGTPITISARRVGDRLVIAVLDRGPGVPLAERARIFEPFYRPLGTSPDVRGTGLGLSIARGLAEAQGGTLRYEARPDGGSIFALELPAVDGPVTEPASSTDLPN